MARPMRRDADYFPFICKEGKTFSILRNRFPLEGIGFFTELCIILTTTPDHNIQLKTDVDFEYLCSKMKCEKDKATAIIEVLLMTGKIHKELWEKANVIVIPDLLDSLQDAYLKRETDIITINQIVSSYINAVSDTGNICLSSNQSLKETKENKTKPDKIIVDSTFDVYWSAYPVKVSKKKAQDIYFKLEKKNALPDIDTHIKIINKWKQTENWKDIKFIPHPTTWLNQERWNDEIPEIKKDIKKDPDNLGLMSKLMGGNK